MGCKFLKLCSLILCLYSCTMYKTLQMRLYNTMHATLPTLNFTYAILTAGDSASRPHRTPNTAPAPPERGLEHSDEGARAFAAEGVGEAVHALAGGQYLKARNNLA